MSSNENIQGQVKQDPRRSHAKAKKAANCESHSSTNKGPSEKHTPSASPTPGQKGSTGPFKRTGSQGKGPSKTTTPVGPQLATEARSLVRPCGCGKPGTFKGQGHHHHETHHKVPHQHEKSKQRSLKSPTNMTPAKTPKIMAPSPAAASQMEICQDGVKRYISTLVWYPRHEPNFFSTTLQVSSGRPTYVDCVHLKPYYQETLREEQLLNKGETISLYKSATKGPTTSSILRVSPIAVT